MRKGLGLFVFMSLLANGCATSHECTTDIDCQKDGAVAVCKMNNNSDSWCIEVECTPNHPCQDGFICVGDACVENTNP